MVILTIFGLVVLIALIFVFNHISKKHFNVLIEETKRTEKSHQIGCELSETEIEKV